jgi:hypothetical protein
MLQHSIQCELTQYWVSTGRSPSRLRPEIAIAASWTHCMSEDGCGCFATTVGTVLMALLAPVPCPLRLLMLAYTAAYVRQ